MILLINLIFVGGLLAGPVGLAVGGTVGGDGGVVLERAAVGG